MEYRFTRKYVHISPKKLRFYLPELRRLEPKEAIITLSRLNGRNYKELHKAIKTAYDSLVHNHKVAENTVKFKNIIVNQAPALKRFRAGGRGMAKPYKRRSSHIIVCFETIKEQKKADKKPNIKKIIKKPLSIKLKTTKSKK